MAITLKVQKKPAAKVEPPKAATGIQGKFAAARREMQASLIEMDEEIDLMLTALICQEHVSLVSPPGMAKSLLANTLGQWMNGKVFIQLFHKFLSPEEVFGSPEIRKSKVGNEEVTRVAGRNTTGMFPECHIALLEEFWHGSPSILRTLMTCLNERYFVNQTAIVKIPLLMAIAVSNRYPGDEDGHELGGVSDRFLFRKTVRGIVTARGEQRLLWERDHTPKLSAQITPAEVIQANAESLKLDWTDDAKKAIEKILQELRKEGINPSPRRKYKSVAAAQAYAYLAGAQEVESEHLEILQHVLWDDPTEQPAKVAKVVARVANPAGMQINTILMAAEEILARTDPTIETQARACGEKLAESIKAIDAIHGNGRAAQVREYLREQRANILCKFVEYGI